MSDDHEIRATRSEEARWRMDYYPWKGEDLDDPEVRLEPKDAVARDVGPWENIRCICGASFLSFNEAAEHMDRHLGTDS